VTLLDAERVSTPEAAPPAAPEGQPPVGALTCASCHAEMAPEQDWCLNCGAAAASGRLGEKPGWRAFSTIAALTIVLVLGAAAASYAALSSDKRGPAVATAPPAQVAQAAPPVAAAPAAPATPAAAAKQSKLPKVKAPSSAPAGAAPVTPVKPAATTQPATPKTTTTPAPSAPRTTTTSPAKTPASTAPVAIKLDPSAGSTYDPGSRTAAAGDAAKALDGDASTSWYLDPSAAGGPIGAGYAINLGSQQAVKRIQLTTTTPGFRVEVYATDEATPPPDITDTRWSHITNASKVGSGSGTQTIVVGAGTSKYQTVLLWITDRPSDGARVRISELKLFG
jgi:hypothetical protein